MDRRQEDEGIGLLEWSGPWFYARVGVLIILLTIMAIPMVAEQLFGPGELIMLQRDISRVQSFWYSDTFSQRVVLVIAPAIYLSVGYVVNVTCPSPSSGTFLRYLPWDYILAAVISVALGAAVWCAAVIVYQAPTALDWGVGIGVALSLSYLAYRVVQAFLISR